ncbi:hypothetical protein SNEBB_002670 [Seison nebaliae]|nr:hypothetical protein SNEBB_002670 [Seison nebaliae]
MGDTEAVQSSTYLNIPQIYAAEKEIYPDAWDNIINSHGTTPMDRRAIMMRGSSGENSFYNAASVKKLELELLQNEILHEQQVDNEFRKSLLEGRDETEGSLLSTGSYASIAVSDVHPTKMFMAKAAKLQVEVESGRKTASEILMEQRLKSIITAKSLSAKYGSHRNDIKKSVIKKLFGRCLPQPTKLPEEFTLVIPQIVFHPAEPVTEPDIWN